MSRRESVELTVLCLVHQGDQLLLQNRVKTDWCGYAPPGGHVEPNESIVDAVIREMSRNRHIVVIEEVGGNSGIRDALSWEICQQHRKCKVDGIDLGDRFVTHGDLQSLYQHYGLDARSIAEFTREVIKGES